MFASTYIGETQSCRVWTDSTHDFDNGLGGAVADDPDLSAFGNQVASDAAGVIQVPVSHGYSCPFSGKDLGGRCPHSAPGAGDKDHGSGD